ncbi:uncharacterized protein [Aphelocoma coerulescens]|uniref:uncharacterized protein n=1 Tax=Aphelocoma coerulescens TaxID=39617 RepID=UPI0036050DF0
MKMLGWHASITRKIVFLTVIIVTISQEIIPRGEDIWSQAFMRVTGLMGKYSDLKNLNLLTVVIHGNQVYTKQEWEKQRTWQLQGTVGEKIKIGCRMINGTTHKKATQISVSTTSTDKHREICSYASEADCWYNFTLVQTVEVVCLWGQGSNGLSFKFQINAMARPTMTYSGNQIRTQVTPLKSEPKVYEIGPYVVRNTGQQLLLFNPEWSLKRVELLMQINISEIQPACSPLIQTSLEGWTAWLQKQTPLKGRMRRDLSGMLGTGLGVINGIDSEILMNKLATATSDLTKLKQPLQSSLLALGNSQWQVSKILPDLAKISNLDHELILNTLGTAQDNVSLAFSCIQAQLWMQSTASLIIREGNEGVFPIEIREAVWNNATKLERKLQSWWTLVNFTYDPMTNIATAFVLTIRNATVYVIHPIVALGLNHKGTVFYPSEHRVWARMVREKWQTVNLESCITREQQGFICESNTLDARDICLDTEQGICHFEIHPDTSPKTVLVYVGQGCVCLRTTCTSMMIDDNVINVTARNHSNFCICNFAKIVGCDFSYLAPVVSHQLIRSNYTVYHKLLPTPIGMNLTLVKQLVKHQDLMEILKEIQRNGEKTLVTVHYDTQEISRILQRVRQDASHNWWDSLFGWSPTATGILNTLCHPIIVLLTLVSTCLALSIALLIWNYRVLKRLSVLTTLSNAHGKTLRDAYQKIH